MCICIYVCMYTYIYIYICKYILKWYYISKFFLIYVYIYLMIGRNWFLSTKKYKK